MHCQHGKPCCRALRWYEAISTDQLSSSAQTSSGNLLHYGIPISKVTGAKLQFKAICQDRGRDRWSHEAVSTWFSCRAKEENYSFLLHTPMYNAHCPSGSRALAGTHRVTDGLLLHLEDFLLEECPAFLDSFSFRTASQGTLPTRLLKRLKSAL